MKKKALVLTAVALFLAVGSSFAAGELFMGTWKLNLAASKIAPEMPNNLVVVYSTEAGNVKVTIDGTAPDGKPLHSEWIGNFDGKGYAVTGDPTVDARTYTLVNRHTLTLIGKKDTKVVQTVRIVVSADGKTRTVTATNIDASGMKTTSISVYDKQ